MATLNVIRRWALRDQMSIREISRRTGLARNTVKKYLRSDETEPSYERRGSSSKLDPYAEKLATWLGIEATKSRKQRRTLRQIHTDSAQKGENQELIHIVSTFCSQRVWVNIRWKTRVRLQRNSTEMDQTTFRSFTRLIQTFCRLHERYEHPLTLVLLLHQEDRALDAARATNHQVTALKWAKEINSSAVEHLILISPEFRAPLPKALQPPQPDKLVAA